MTMSPEEAIREAIHLPEGLKRSRHGRDSFGIMLLFTVVGAASGAAFMYIYALLYAFGSLFLYEGSGAFLGGSLGWLVGMFINARLQIKYRDQKRGFGGTEEHKSPSKQ